MPQGAAAQVPVERLLVRPKFQAREHSINAIFASHHAQEQATIPHIGVRILRVRPNESGAVLQALNRNPNIEFAEPDVLLAPEASPNDPLYGNQWHLPRISAPAAWDMKKTEAVIIAILDSGVDSGHPDLRDVLTPGWNFFDNTANTSDVTGHGTAIAGTAAAAVNNGVGVAAIGWGCRIMPVRVSDTNGYASLSAIANGLVWSADQGVRVASVSFRASGSLTVSQAAQYFQSRGGVVAISAGNQGVFDSAADNPYVLTVSATDDNDGLAPFSNTGNNIDLCAPGLNVVTCARGGSYGSGSGTSYSAPLVSGIAALVIGSNPSLSGIEVQNILKGATDDLGPAGWDPTFGAGRVNAHKALLDAAATVDTNAPLVSLSTPLPESVVSGVVTIDITASDDVGITFVECYLNGLLAGTNSSAPAAFLWDTSGYADGFHTLQGRACDPAGNFGLSAPVRVFVQNTVPDKVSPSVQITSPADGSAIVDRKVMVAVRASDNVGVVRVDFLVDGKPYATSSASSPTFSWVTSKLARGTHFIQAVAFDAAGNATRSSAVRLYK